MAKSEELTAAQKENINNMRKEILGTRSVFVELTPAEKEVLAEMKTAIRIYKILRDFNREEMDYFMKMCVRV